MKLPAFHWQILLALVAAVAAGIANGETGPALPTFVFMGTLFLNALKMLVVPLIVASIIQGLIGIGDPHALSRMGWKAIAYYVATCAMAVVTGLLVINVFQPGIVDGHPAAQALGLTQSHSDEVARIGHKDLSDIGDVFLRMLPPNLIKAAADGDILGLILFSMLFGFFAAHLPEPLLSSQQNFWRGLQAVMLKLTGFVMRFAPLGVFGLVAKTIAITGWASVRPLAAFFACVLLGLALHLLVNLPLTLRFIARVSPWRHLRAMSPALLTAFSTSSSAATLPVTFDCLQSRAFVSPRVTNFVLPLGASINLDGSALYECAVAMFLAQAYGLELSLATQFLVVWLALVTSMGISGIPSSSLVGIAVILGAIGLPLEGIGAIMAVDRVLDMCRTAVNVFGDSCGAVVIARLEGDEGVLGEPALKR